MTSEKDKENTDAVLDYQAVVESASAKIKKATKKASNHLTNDMFDILDVYAAKGGFESPEEAYAYLDGYIEPKDRKVLIAAARRLPEPDRTRELTRLSSNAYKWRIKRTEAINKVQMMASKTLQSDIEKILIPDLEKTVEKGTKHTMYSVQKQLGMGFRFDLPSKKNIEQVIIGTGVYDKVKLFSKAEMEEVKVIVTQGMLSGRDLRTMTKEVEQFTGKSAYKSRRLVRTTVAQAAVDAELKELKELGIEEYEIQCTYDERTCPICRKYDQKKYKVGEGPTPTFHPNCRCRVRQVFPPEIQATARKAARNVQGKHVTIPQDMSYNEWAKTVRIGKGPYAMGMKDLPKLSSITELSKKGPVVNVPKPEPPKPKIGSPDEDPFHSVTKEEWDKLRTVERRREYAEKRLNKLKATKPPASESTRKYLNTWDISASRDSLLRNKWRREITDKEKQAVRLYSGSSAKEWINPALYDTKKYVQKGGLTGSAPMEALAKMRLYEHLDKAISKFELNDPITVRRGMWSSPFNVPPEDMIGKIYTSDSYWSTSIKTGTAEKFGSNYNFYVKVPKGKGLGAYIEPFSLNAEEHEFLIKRDAKYAVLDATKDNRGRYHIYVELIG